MGLPNSVEGVRHFAERTLHSLVELPGSYAARLKSGYKAYKELGRNRLVLPGLSFLAAFASPASAIAAPFNNVPENLGSRNAIVLPLKSINPTDPNSIVRVTGKLDTGFTAIVNKQEANPPEEPAEVEEPQDATDAGATDEPIKLDVPPPVEGQVNPSNALDQLGPNQAAVLSLTESNVSAEAQLNLPYLRRFQSKDGKVGFNNTGDQVGLTEGDAELLDQTITFLANKYRPNGVEFFFPNGSLEPDFNKPGYVRLRDRLKNFSYEDVFLGGYTNSFLGNTGIVTGERLTDGVTEVHLALILKPGVNQTPENIRDINLMLTETLAWEMIGGRTDTTKDDLATVRRLLTTRRGSEEDKLSPLILAIATS